MGKNYGLFRRNQSGKGSRNAFPCRPRKPLENLHLIWVSLDRVEDQGEGKQVTLVEKGEAFVECRTAGGNSSGVQVDVAGMQDYLFVLQRRTLHLKRVRARGKNRTKRRG